MWIPIVVAGTLAIMLLSGGSASARASGRRKVPRPKSFPSGLKDGSIVPFAVGEGQVWPVISPSPHRLEVPYVTSGNAAADGVNPSKAVNLARSFHASRDPASPRFHAGIDLFANPGDVIQAMEDGVVQGHATGYVGLDALVIDHPTATVVYAEFLPDKGLVAGTKVQAGQRLGVAVASQGKPTSPVSTMLHVETWQRGKPIGNFTPWYVGQAAPSGLLDPTVYLLRTAGLDPT